MMMKKKHGEGFTPSKKTDKKPPDLLEQGKKRKRECINRIRDEESLEEIKEWVFAKHPHHVQNDILEHEDSTNQRYPY
jgi:hypothetical protein